MKSKHGTVGTTATTVTITKAAGGATLRHLIVINRDNGATGDLYFTIATNGNTPTTAVATADDTAVAAAGLSAVPADLGNTDEVQVSIIATAASTPYSILAG